MASTSVNTHVQHYKVILLGKTGSGISASGNTILGKKSFISKKIFKSVTQEVQNETAIFHEVTLDVYDTPGLFNTETSNEDVLNEWKSLLKEDKRTCTVILLVMKVDRFTLEDKEAVPLMENSIPERLIQNTWILFTRGDELNRGDLTIEQFIEDTEELKKLVNRFQNRYHVFDNFSQSPSQVQKLINKIKKTARITFSQRQGPEGFLHQRIVLLGKTGVGKSSTGNTILGEQRFRSGFSSSSITSVCEIQRREVSERNISVIDTPGLFDTKLSREKLSVEIGRSIYQSSPGPHAFLYILPVNIRFTEQEEDVIQKLELIFGREMKKYTMILFTHGDQLEGKSVDMLIQENRSLRRLVEECGGGYHIFNNKHLRNRQQVSELLQKIDGMVEENGGTCYSTEMYEEAARIRRNDTRGDNEGFTEFYQNNKRSLFIAAGVGCGVVVTGVTIGAIVGGVVGGPVGAGIGAGIGVGISTVIGASAGVGVHTCLCRNAEQNNHRSQNTERESAPHNDGGHESPDSERMSDEAAPLIPASNIRHRSTAGRSQYQE